MTDHTGNYIQLGDTLVLVDTKHECGKFTWIVMARLKVTHDFPEIFVELQVSPSHTMTYHIDTVMKRMSPEHILCIEGKSDNEIDYYLKYFEA